MKKILALLLVLCSFVFAKGYDAQAVDKHYKILLDMSPKQKEVLFATYTTGKKHGLKVISAIAWNESNLGEVNVNLKDGRYGSYGTYHALMDTVLARYKLKPSKHNIAVLSERLKTDFEFSSNEVIAELKYWKNRYKKDSNQYEKMLASYNAGTKGLNSTAGIRYKEVTVNRVKAIDRYMETHKHEYASYLDTKTKTAYYAKLKANVKVQNNDATKLLMASIKPSYSKPYLAMMIKTNNILFLKPHTLT